MQKLFYFEVDQSNRIENLVNRSVISIANASVSYTIILPQKAKRRIHEKFRYEGKLRQFAPRVFGAIILHGLTYFKLKGYKIREIVIDREYDGHENRILASLLPSFSDMEVRFSSIGKKSPAHLAAYAVFRKKKKADTVISVDQILKLVHKI